MTYRNGAYFLKDLIAKLADQIFKDLYAFSKTFSSDSHARFVAVAFTGFFFVSNILVPLMIGFIIFSEERGQNSGGVLFGVLTLIVLGLSVYRYEFRNKAEELISTINQHPSVRPSIIRGLLFSIEMFVFPATCIWLLIELMGE